MYNHTIKLVNYKSNVDAAFTFVFILVLFIFVCGLWWGIFYESSLFFRGNLPKNAPKSLEKQQEEQKPMI